MGICGTWKIEKTMPKVASKRCNRGAGKIGVMKGPDYSCEKSAAEAMMLTYEVRGQPCAQAAHTGNLESCA